MTSAMNVEASSRSPVLIGAALVSAAQTVNEAMQKASDPIDLMAQAVRRAAADTGNLRVLNDVDLIGVVGGLWSYRDPAALVAQQLGINPGRTLLTDFGGQVPVQLCADIADKIQRGEIDVAVLLGGECNATRRALTRGGQRPAKRDEPANSKAEYWGSPLVMGDLSAVDRGGDLPINTYAVLDSALRVAYGETLDEARQRSARICATYSHAAATNPHAATQLAMSAEQVREPSQTNRMVSWPYTKAMCANNTVDHAGAIIMCSAAGADRLDIAPVKRVYPHLFSLGADTDTLAERFELADAPGLRATCDSLVNSIGGIERVAHFDLYCCFPSMVTLTANALGVDPYRTLTVTGGLGFAGAPINFAAGEGLIGMIARLRSDPGSLGVVQANGGHASKHAFGVFSTSPSPGALKITSHVPNGPTRPAAAADASGPAVVDGVTVEYHGHEPFRAVALVRFDNGARCWANSDDQALMRSVTLTEWVGRAVTVSNGRFARS